MTKTKRSIIEWIDKERKNHTTKNKIECARSWRENWKETKKKKMRRDREGKWKKRNGREEKQLEMMIKKSSEWE